MDDLISIRKHLHQYPELSGLEYETQRFLKRQLQELELTELCEVGNTGLLAVFSSDIEGPSILLRADIDALPIQEVNTFSHQSKKGRESHKCGHDGHATVMLGVARYFSKNPPQAGTISILFQPAEETGEGARAVLNDAQMQNRQFDQAYAFHNLPGYELGQIICKPGLFAAGAVSVSFRLYGETSHAAEPEKGKNPALAIAEILKLSESLAHPDKNDDAFRLITPVYANMGEQAYGTSAGYGEVHFTLRAWQMDKLEALKNQLREKAREIVAKYQLIKETDWFEEFHPNVNSEKAFQNVRHSAGQLNYSFNEIDKPFKWTEDFGLISEKYSGAIFGVGAGVDHPPLHSAHYDFPDEIIEPSVNLFVQITKNALRKHV